MAALVQPAPASLSSNLTAPESIGLDNKITKCIYRVSDPKRSKTLCGPVQWSLDPPPERARGGVGVDRKRKTKDEVEI